ncbi:MAG: hypothetical protein DRI86_03445 [Bacteroidetes bacterium]|nr:MAG: hypothetical protein DRI86_03445 [Bacteroidota bacterium]
MDSIKPINIKNGSNSLLGFNSLLFVIYGLFIIFIGLPIIYTFGTVLFENDLSNSFKLLNNATFSLLFKSLILASSVGIISTFFGTILGFLLYKTNLKLRSFYKIVLLIPLFISPYILAVAWKDFFFFLFGNSSLISSYFGVIMVLSLIFIPLAMLIIGSALSNIDSQIEESALMLVSFKKMVFSIILPLIKPALITSFVLIFIFSISEFSVPAFFGVKVFTTEIFTQFSAFYNHSLAIIQSTLLIAICIILLYAERKYIADAPFLSVGSKGTNNKLYDIINYRKLGQLFLIVWLFISIVLPFIILFAQSFKGGMDSFIRAYDLLLPTFVNSIFLAFMAAIISVFIGFIAAYFSIKRSKIYKSFEWFLLLVFAIPSTIYGISLIKFYNQPELSFIYSTSAIIIIGYVGKYTFISAKLISNAIKQIPNSIDEVSQIQGIPIFSRLTKILIPIILPTIFIAFIISFIFSLGELGTTIMLYPPGTEIMPIKVFTIMANAPQALISSMTLIVFSVTLLMISIFYFMLNPFIKKYHSIND